MQKYFNGRVPLFDLLPSERGDIIFVGNSLTEGFLVNEMFQDLKIKNRGIASSKTIDVIDRLNNIIKSEPSKIFFEIGVNDIKWGGCYY